MDDPVVHDDTDVLDEDLTAPALYRDGFPHELFARLRGSGAVLRHRRVRLERAPDGMEFRVVLRHAEIEQASRDVETFSSLDGPSIGGAPEMRGQMLVFADPPVHTRLRRLISAGFTPRMVARLDDLIARRTAEILDPVVARGTCEFVREVAYLLPMHLIADMVGIPDADRPRVFSLTDRLMRAGDPRSGLTPADRLAVQAELFQYAQGLGAEKRQHPADDLWSLLAVAEIEDDRGERARLSGWELDLFFLLLSVAGSETTRNAIAHGLLALLERPDAFAALRAAPSLLDTGVDEIVRWASPVTCFARTATRDTELGGRRIARGERVALFYPSANRDERVFAEPFRFDLGRTPNPHVGFGGPGAHFCVGAHLARRQIRTMFEGLLARTRDVELAGAPRWMAGGPDQSVAVSLDHLPVRLHAR